MTPTRAQIEQAVEQAPKRIAELAAETASNWKRLQDAQAVLTAAKLNPRHDEALKLALAAQALVDDADDALAASRERLEVYIAEIRGYMDALKGAS
jgi:hypothetical protein